MKGRCPLNWMSLVMSRLQTDNGVVVSTGWKMRDQERQVGKCRRIIREVVENVDGQKQDYWNQLEHWLETHC